MLRLRTRGVGLSLEFNLLQPCMTMWHSIPRTSLWVCACHVHLSAKLQHLVTPFASCNELSRFVKLCISAQLMTSLNYLNILQSIIIFSGLVAGLTVCSKASPLAYGILSLTLLASQIGLCLRKSREVFMTYSSVSQQEKAKAASVFELHCSPRTLTVDLATSIAS